MLDALIELGVEHHAAIEVQKPPPVVFLEVPAEHGFGAAILAADGREMNLLVARLKHPCAGLVDHAEYAVALGRRASETWYEPPNLVEDRLDGETSRPVDEADLAVERHARQAIDQRTWLLEPRLDEPASV